MSTMTCPSSFSATAFASCFSSRLRASMSARCVSKRLRLASVARNAFLRGKRKLRANPSLTRTTSPIWPSLATRSSKMTSMLFLLRSFKVQAGISRKAAGRGTGERADAQRQHHVRKAEKRERKKRPGFGDQDDGVTDAEDEGADRDASDEHMRGCETLHGQEHEDGARDRDPDEARPS